MRSAFFLSILCLSACAAAPAQMSAEKTGPKERPFYADAPFYFDYTAFDPTKVQVPPAPGSKEDEQDLAELDRFQKTRSQTDCEAAGKEVKPDFENFFGEMSPFQKPTAQVVDEIFWRLRSDIGRTVSKIKKHYNRERPYRRDANRFVPCIKLEDGKAYPSGHAAISRLFASVLAELDPKNMGKYFAHAEESALNRVVGGVHHRSDIVMGKKIADQVYAAMKESPAYKADLASLRSLLAK